MEEKKIIISNFFTSSNENIDFIIENLKGPNYVEPVSNLLFYTIYNSKIIEKND